MSPYTTIVATPENFPAASPADSSVASRTWFGLIDITDPVRRRGMAALVVSLVLGLGAIDFYLGFEVSLLVFYCLPVCLAVLSLGWRAGAMTAVLSVAAWLVGDLAAGAHYATYWILGWNAVIALGTYLVVIGLFAMMLSLHREMEERVRQRTVALTDEMTERTRLEKEILEIGERERRAIGHDLHDGLGQHLTATALAAEVLRERLQNGTAQPGEARRIVELVEHAIDQSRNLAKGLLLAEVAHDSLLAMLHELAVSTRDQLRVACVFEGPDRIVLPDNSSASHLYRITQEAVRNAARHGRARRIDIALSVQPDGLLLSVTDDGVGLSVDQRRPGPGMGLRIMAHRAAMIGAQFTIETPANGGTRVLCRLSAP